MTTAARTRNFMTGHSTAKREQLLQAARQTWVETNQLDMGALAQQLGIGRATIFRWAGSRDALLAEVIWSFHQPDIEAALTKSKLRGAELLAHLCRCSMQAALEFEPMRRWSESDPEYALKILNSEQNVIFQRATAFTEQVLLREQAEGYIQPMMPLTELARLLVRIETSFLFSDLACGQPPSIDSACTAVWVLCQARHDDITPPQRGRAQS